MRKEKAVNKAIRRNSPEENAGHLRMGVRLTNSKISAITLTARAKPPKLQPKRPEPCLQIIQLKASKPVPGPRPRQHNLIQVTAVPARVANRIKPQKLLTVHAFRIAKKNAAETFEELRLLSPY